MFGEKKKKEEPRFVQCYSGVAKDFGNVKILVDTETGVQYLITWSTEEASGCGVLVDQDGKPLITRRTDAKRKKNKNKWCEKQLPGGGCFFMEVKALTAEQTLKFYDNSLRRRTA